MNLLCYYKGTRTATWHNATG